MFLLDPNWLFIVDILSIEIEMYVVLVVCEAIDTSSRLMGMSKSGVARGNAAREAVCFALLLQGRGCRFVTDSHALSLCTVAKAA